MKNVKRLFFATLWAVILLFSVIGIIINNNNAQGAIATTPFSTTTSSNEICNDGIDNNKNGQIDEDCSGSEPPPISSLTQ